MPCPCCKTVNTIAFWGPMPEKPWKRPALLVLSLLGSAGLATLLWLAWTRSAGASLIVLVAVSLAAFLLSFFVSLRGCNACVARIFGSL
jgi:hypothetical protein